MKIEKTRVWNEKKVVWTILKETPTLDPLVLIKNSDLYTIKKEGEIVSFLTIKNVGKHIALGTVYTFPDYRKKGFMKSLIKKVLRNRNEIYLICYSEKNSFYRKFGFVLQDKSPWSFRIKKFLGNIFIAPYSGKKLIVMKRSF